jgi:ABC-type lipoprotein release transport system permease subunit
VALRWASSHFGLAFVVLVRVVSSWVPAYRAIRIDVEAALRY